MPGGAVLRYENMRLTFFQDNQNIGTIYATEFSYEDDMQDDKAKYQGREIPSGSASYNGGSGSCTLEHFSGDLNIDDMIDAYKAGVRANNNRGKINIQLTVVHGDSSSVIRKFDNCRISSSFRGSQNQRLTTTLRFMYDIDKRLQ